jgi:hypothetical protein
VDSALKFTVAFSLNLFCFASVFVVQLLQLSVPMHVVLIPEIIFRGVNKAKNKDE